jgi:superfamily II DNA/RNA helicase
MGLSDIQFFEPTPIQEKSIPIVLEGKDLLGTAQTGTGKTGAFVIPIIERVLQSNRDGVKALIITPTRELAQQIDEQIFAIGYHTGISSATVIGGSDFSVQAKALKAGADIIVATPGRLIDQNKVAPIDFSKLEFLVLDEADRMMDMGFMPDMKKIISWTPEKRQTLMFSATMPADIEKLSRSILKNPDKIQIAAIKPSGSVEQRAYMLKSDQKVSVVKKIFKSVDWESCIIFTSTKKGTDELQRLLKRQGIKAASIHGDRTQDERNKALQSFVNGEYKVIVATDVLARGIDIKGVSIILNYDVPNNTDDYIHRIGRTGRYDKSGIAITFVTRRDSRLFSQIDGIKGNKINKIEIPDNFDDKSPFQWDDKAKPAPAKSEKTTPESKTEESDKKEAKESVNKTSDRQQHDKRRSDKKPSEKKDSVKSNQRSQDSNKSDSSRSDRNKRDNRQDRGQKDQREQRSSDKSRQSDRQDSKHDNRREQPNKQQTANREPAKPVVIPPVIEKASERKKHARKPAKGVWGIIKSLIPKF